MSEYTEGAQTLMDQGNLVGALVMASMGATQEATNTLLDSITRERDELKVTLEIIMSRIERLAQSETIPATWRFLDALTVSRSDVHKWLTANHEDHL